MDEQLQPTQSVNKRGGGASALLSLSCAAVTGGVGWGGGSQSQEGAFKWGHGSYSRGFLSWLQCSSGFELQVVVLVVVEEEDEDEEEEEAVPVSFSPTPDHL